MLTGANVTQENGEPMKIPEAENNIASLIDRHHESKSEPPRPHMGASQLGHPCDRWLWLSFRWAVVPTFPGRVLRIFRRGHAEEANIVSDLRAVGMDVRAGQRQLKFSGHVAGTPDAIIETGVPEAPKTRHVAEFKTHNAKSFTKVERNGVRDAKPEHWSQMQVYMHGTGTERALYVAVCKDDDRIYTERVHYDAEAAAALLERGRRLSLADRMPEPLSADPSWYQCKFCPAHAFCHETRTTREVNCRTCAHSTAKEDGSWRCERHDADGIPVEFQRAGCDSHVLHPDLVPWQMKDSDWPWIAVYEIDGKDVANGEGDARVYTSREILANPAMCASGDPFVEAVREAFDGRITL